MEYKATTFDSIELYVVIWQLPDRATTFDSWELNVEVDNCPIRPLPLILLSSTWNLTTWHSNKITIEWKHAALTLNLAQQQDHDRMGAPSPDPILGTTLYQKSEHVASTETQSTGYKRLLFIKSNLLASVDRISDTQGPL